MEIFENSPEQVGAAAAYVRCAAQDADGNELRKRTAETLAVAAEHRLTVGPENVVAEYGAGTSLPGLMKLLARVENGHIKTVVVTRLDRLTRLANSKAGQAMFQALLAASVKVITTDDVFDLSQPKDVDRWRLAGSLQKASASKRGRIVASKRGRAAAKARLG